MFRVNAKAYKNNSKSVKRMHSTDTYDTIESAKKFVDSHIEKQYGDCMRAWGLTAIDTIENDKKITAIFKSACNIFSCTQLKIDYEIVEI